MSVASQKRRPFKTDFSRRNRQQSADEGCSNVVTSSFSKKTLTKTDRCAGALSWSWKQLLVLHFSRRCLQTEPQSRRTYMYISWFTVSIPVNYTTEIRELFQAPTYGWPRNGQGRGSILGRARSIYHTTITSTIVNTQDRRARLSLICIYRCTYYKTCEITAPQNS
jgi:hypothetical protein